MGVYGPRGNVAPSAGDGWWLLSVAEPAYVSGREDPRRLSGGRGGSWTGFGLEPPMGNVSRRTIGFLKCWLNLFWATGSAGELAWLCAGLPVRSVAPPLASGGAANRPGSIFASLRGFSSAASLADDGFRRFCLRACCFCSLRALLAVLWASRCADAGASRPLRSFRSSSRGEFWVEFDSRIIDGVVRVISLRRCFMAAACGDTAQLRLQGLAWTC